MSDSALVSTTSPGVPGAGADGFFSIRFESIGGLGAHLAGQILAEAVVLRQGLNGSHFSSYGSEKKGTPVQSFLRFCASDREIRTSSPIERPQVVVVFHEALVGSGNVAAGLGPTGTIIVNTVSTPDEIRELLGLRAGTVTVVDGLGIAVEESTRPNIAMLGAVVRVCPFIDPDAIRETIARRSHAATRTSSTRTSPRSTAASGSSGARPTGRPPARSPEGRRVRPPPSATSRRRSAARSSTRATAS